MGVRRALLPYVPSGLLVRLSRHHRLKGLLRSIFSSPRHAGQIETVTIRRGPAKGLIMRLDMGTDERRFADGTYEPWIHQMLPKVLRPGMVLWDIGAHVGYYVLAASALSPGVTHVAVEPGPNVLPRLRENLALNGVTARVVTDAIGSEAGTASFVMHDDGIVSRLGEEGGETVNVVPLDSLLDQFPGADLVMMDIEGHEGSVLSTCRRLLDDIRPTWLIELHGEGGALADEIMSAHGYRRRLADEGVPLRDQLAYQRVHALYEPILG